MKRIIFTVMMACFLVPLTACGGSSSPPRTAQESTANAMPAIEEERNGTDDARDGTKADSSNDAAPDNREAEKDTSGEESEMSSDDGKIEGLILMQAETTTPTTLSGYSYIISTSISILCFDPATGATRTISTFPLNKMPSGATLSGFATRNGWNGITFWFDQDYTKIAVKYQIDANGDQHAGWIDQNGSFFDVTEAVGMARKSEFDGRVDQEPMGFTKDGMFVIKDYGSELSHRPKNTKVYSVPIDDIRPETVIEGSTFETVGGSYYTTDQLDDGRFLAVKDEACYVVSPDGTGRLLASTESRKSWSAVASPDGTQAAFISKPKVGEEAPDIFIVPIDGGDPVRAANHDSFSFKMGLYQMSMMQYGGNTELVGWR